jgi:F-type H+-transporting ATPase subunit delta
MEKVTASRQYAKALFDSCQEQHLVERVEVDLKTMNNELNTESEIRSILMHPEIPIEEKRSVLKELMPEGLSSESVAFLYLLLEHRLLDLLPEISQIFARMRLESFGILKAVVETTHSLTSASKEQLITALAFATGREIILEEKLNSNLIGGVRVHVGDRILDASIVGRLNRLKEKILTSEIKK